MNEYIEREKAVKLLRDTAAEGATPYHIGLLAAAKAIEAIPAADVVERASGIIGVIPAADVRPVVLCGDCKFYQQSHYIDNHMECARSGFPAHSVDFCSFGEKREES